MKKNLKTILMVVAAIIIAYLAYRLIGIALKILIFGVFVFVAFVAIKSFMKKKEVKQSEESQKGDN